MTNFYYILNNLFLVNHSTETSFALSLSFYEQFLHLCIYTSMIVFPVALIPFSELNKDLFYKCLHSKNELWVIIFLKLLVQIFTITCYIFHCSMMCHIMFTILDY